MGKLAKDYFHVEENVLAFTASFSNDSIELENGRYRLGEVITEFLNYDPQKYIDAVDVFKTYCNSMDFKNIRAACKELYSIVSKMPLYKYALGKSFIIEPSFWQENFPIPEGTDDPEIVAFDKKTIMRYLKGYSDLKEDLIMIKHRYNQFLCDMDFSAKLDKNDNRYVKILDYSLISPYMSGVSLGANTTVDPAQVSVSYVLGKNQDGGIEIYEKILFQRLIDFVFLELFKAMMQQNIPKKCKNCGAYFLLEKGYKYEYCDKALASDPKKTCREAGASISYQLKVENDLVWKIHKRAYKKYYARVKKNHMTREVFEAWASDAEKLRNTLVGKELPEAELTIRFNNLQ